MSRHFVATIVSAQKIEVYMDLPQAMNYERSPGTPKRIKDPFGTGGMR
ncbi:hypothetical protein [Asticcacaulis sp.]